MFFTLKWCGWASVSSPQGNHMCWSPFFWSNDQRNKHIQTLNYIVSSHVKQLFVRFLVVWYGLIQSTDQTGPTHNLFGIGIYAEQLMTHGWQEVIWIHDETPDGEMSAVHLRRWTEIPNDMKIPNATFEVTVPLLWFCMAWGKLALNFRRKSKGFKF